MMSQTGVSAVMVTGKDPRRKRLALAAILSFLNQTYPHTELVIVNDGDPILPLLPPGLPRHDRLREIMVGRGLTLGELRNRAQEEAQHDWIIQWDDDDWYHPSRIAVQMTHSLRTGLPSTFMYQVRYSFLNDNAFTYKQGPNKQKRNLGIPGTILYPRTNLRYLAEGRHEDSHFIQEFEKVHVIMNRPGTKPGPEVYLRFSHDANTWDLRHIMGAYAQGTHRWAVSNDESRYLGYVLETYYKGKDSPHDGVQQGSEVAPPHG